MTTEALQQRIELLERKLKREKTARIQAETLLEEKSLSLYQLNKELSEAYNTLKKQEIQIIQQEKIELRDVMDKDKRNALYDLFEDNYEGGSLTPLKDLAGDDFTWDELKLYQASLMV